MEKFEDTQHLCYENKLQGTLGKKILEFLEQLGSIEIEGCYYDVQVLQDYPITQVVSIRPQGYPNNKPRYFSINTRFRNKPPIKYRLAKAELSIYSYDDGHIGLLSKDNRCLAVRLIERPTGLIQHDWYNHARKTCKLLNSKAK